MVNRLLAAVLLAALPWIARAQDQGFTNRSTELKASGAADSATLATLPENTPVKVLARGGGWTRVEAGGKSGWVRVFHLRFPAAVESSSSSGGGLASLGSALGFGHRNEQARLATTGIRGLSTEDVKNANPDPAQLARMQSFRADRPAAERFAREAKLVEARIEVPSDSGKEGSR
ncbi:MAG TPA: SH3 domain-containing protein [Usitatibacter sp.]|nr:SH3 domain-containing protein [Usitatibacter sp.]